LRTPRRARSSSTCACSASCSSVPRASCDACMAAAAGHTDGTVAMTANAMRRTVSRCSGSR
jgi:hypothetical protein